MTSTLFATRRRWIAFALTSRTILHDGRMTRRTSRERFLPKQGGLKPAPTNLPICACAVPRRYRPRRRRCSIISPRRREVGGPVVLRNLRGPVSLTGGQSQASFNDLGAWLQCAVEGEMVDQPTAKDRLIDRRSVLRTGAALAPAPRPVAGRQRRPSANSWSVPRRLRARKR